MSNTSTVTPNELADSVNRDPKAVRAFLRANFGRPADQKNARWEVDAKTQKAVKDHYASIDKARSAKAS